MFRSFVTSAFQSVLSAAICVAAIATVSGCNRGPDISTPKKAAAAFVTALQAGDMDAIKKCAVGSDADFAAVKNMSDMFQAAKKYQDAITAKFGAQPKNDNAPDAHDLTAGVDNSDEKIDGDKATLVPKDAKNMKGLGDMTFKKDSDGWKVDLSSQTTSSAEMTKTAKPMIDAFNATAKEVDDGKFKTAQDAQMAMIQRMTKSMIGQ